MNCLARLRPCRPVARPSPAGGAGSWGPRWGPSFLCPPESHEDAYRGLSQRERAVESPLEGGRSAGPGDAGASPMAGRAAAVLPWRGLAEGEPGLGPLRNSHPGLGRGSGAARWLRNPVRRAPRRPLPPRRQVPGSCSTVRPSVPHFVDLIGETSGPRTPPAEFQSVLRPLRDLFPAR